MKVSYLPLLALIIVAGLTSAQAQTVRSMASSSNGNIDVYDLPQGDETHPMIRLTPDYPQIVHLDSDARSIIVGNPAHLNVFLDTSTSMVLVPRDPGATHITVLGMDGKVIMQRYVIVASPADKYIRIRRYCGSTGSNGASCAQTTVFYCPDMCYETKILNSALGQSATPTAPPPVVSDTQTPTTQPPSVPATAPQPVPAVPAPSHWHQGHSAT